MVWCARALVFHRDPPVPMAEALDKRTDILRKTSHYDGRHPAFGLDPPNEAWEGLKAQLADKINAHADAADTTDLEAECWAILQPLVEPGLRQAYADSQPFGRGPYGCWHYDTRESAPDTVNLHVSNAYQPESPFAANNRPRLVQTLLQLLHDAQETHPAVVRLRCGSWLNQLPPFLSLFPPSWASTFTARDYSGGTGGYWGQYMDRRGALHQRNAAALRATGAHPYPSGTCHCPIADAIRHLCDQAV